MTTIQTTSRPRRSALVALWIGLGLTVLAAVYPWVDRVTSGVLGAHVQLGYPAYGPAAINRAVLAYAGILTVIGVLGLAGWLVAIAGARKGRRWTPWLATGLLAAGALLAMSAFTITDTSGMLGLAPLHGWLLVLPCLAGATATALLWRRS